VLEIAYVRERFDLVRERLAARGGDYGLDRFADLDAERRRLLRESESLKQR
jgi:seryl-tRNA synthetase